MMDEYQEIFKRAFHVNSVLSGVLFTVPARLGVGAVLAVVHR
jgi:hypothetical protein